MAIVPALAKDFDNLDHWQQDCVSASPLWMHQLDQLLRATGWCALRLFPHGLKTCSTSCFVSTLASSYSAKSDLIPCLLPISPQGLKVLLKLSYLSFNPVLTPKRYIERMPPSDSHFVGVRAFLTWKGLFTKPRAKSMKGGSALINTKWFGNFEPTNTHDSNQAPNVVLVRPTTNPPWG